jgi:hypothetical protein
MFGSNFYGSSKYGAGSTKIFKRIALIFSGALKPFANKFENMFAKQDPYTKKNPYTKTDGKTLASDDPYNKKDKIIT